MAKVAKKMVVNRMQKGFDVVAVVLKGQLPDEAEESGRREERRKGNALEPDVQTEGERR